MVLVDASVWMEAARRNGRLEYKISLEALIAEAEALICGPVRMEVLTGARPEDRPALSVGFESIPYRAMQDEDWLFVTECANKLSDNNLHLPFRAILVASLALKWDCRIYTLDPAMTAMEAPLGLRLYLPGYGGKFHPEPPRPAVAPPTEPKPIPAAPQPKFSPSPAGIELWD